MTTIINGSSPSITFSDSTTQTTAFNGQALSASPYTTSLGASTLVNNTGTANVAVGNGALAANTTASNNTAVGYQAGYSNTTSPYNTLIGQQAGYNITTSAGFNTAVGIQTLYNCTTGTENTCIGEEAGNKITTGNFNTLLGAGAGYNISTGNKNIVIGSYSGNQGGLDIRTASNNIVLSDGDGNPYAKMTSGNGYVWTFGMGGTGASYYGGAIVMNGTTYAGQQALLVGQGNGTSYWYCGTQGNIAGSSSTNFMCQNAGGGGVYLNGAGATSWTAFSDSRLKNITGTYTNALTDIQKIEPIKFTWKSDETKKPCVGVVAQSVLSVVPEAVCQNKINKEDEIEYYSVSYTDLIPLMIASIQELKAEFDAYKATHP